MNVQSYLSSVGRWLKTLNKWQLIVILLAIGAAGWLLLRAYVFKPLCLNTLCPEHDPTLLPRLAFLVVATVVAVWLLREPKGKNDKVA